MKMFPDHDEYANMPQDVKRMKVGRAAGGGESVNFIPDDTMAEADSIVRDSVSRLRKYSTKQK